VKKIHQSYYLPSMTPISAVIFEDEPMAPVPPSELEAYREHAAHELAGVENIEGSYPFTLDRSVKAFRLNEFLHRLIEPGHRERFLQEPEVLFAEAGLSEEERDMLRRRDWRALIRYGVIFFLLEKLAAVIGTTNLHVYAGMRGQSLDEFQKTRNAEVLYSVAGQDKGKTEWDKRS
jgi:gallate dioxygenase